MTDDEIDAFDPWPELGRIFSQQHNDIERLANMDPDQDPNIFNPKVGDRVRVTGCLPAAAYDGMVGAEGVVTGVLEEDPIVVDGVAYLWAVETDQGFNLLASALELVEDEVDVLIREVEGLIGDDEDLEDEPDAYEVRVHAVSTAFELLRQYGQPTLLDDVLDLADFLVGGTE